MDSTSNKKSIEYDKYKIDFILDEYITNSARTMYNLTEISKKKIVVVEECIVQKIRDRNDEVIIEIVSEEFYRRGYGERIDVYIPKQKINSFSQNVYALNPGDKIVVLLAPEFKANTSAIECTCYDLRSCKFGYITKNLKIGSKEEYKKLLRDQKRTEEGPESLELKRIEELTEEEIKIYADKYEIYSLTGDVNKKEYLSGKEIKNEITYTYILVLSLIAIIIFLLTGGLIRIILEVFILAIIGGSIISIKENKQKREDYIKLLKACYDAVNNKHI